jgi:uncharacterized protein YegP (UPF0339 family)
VKFEVYMAHDGWRWRLVSRNGRIMADSGESYTRRRDVVRAIDRTELGSLRARIVYTGS